LDFLVDNQLGPDHTQYERPALALGRMMLKRAMLTMLLLSSLMMCGKDS
jgi:hypothetical protein